MIRLLAISVAAFLLAAPASALFDPPANCRATPPASAYQLHHVSNVHTICRKMGMEARFLTTYAACTIRTAHNGKRYPKPLIFLPPKGAMMYRSLLRHELGHVVCPHWTG